MDLKTYRLDALPDSVDDTCLSAEEKAFLPHRKTARALLRHELGLRLQCSAKDIVFSVNEHGKPFVQGQHFNISHSGECLCMAFHHLPVGVDVERIRPRARMPKLAAQFMCAEQAEAFLARGCPEDEFYACWCAAEALVKMHGDTIWNAKKYPFLYRKGRIEVQGEEPPEVLLFTPMPGYCGAVAYE